MCSAWWATRRLSTKNRCRANPYVENVQRVSEPYKKANRLFHEADSIIDVGGIKVGGSEKIAVIGGPCSIESEEQAVRIAREVKDAGGCMLRGGAYKPAHLSLCVPGPWHRGHFGHGGGA